MLEELVAGFDHARLLCSVTSNVHDQQGIMYQYCLISLQKLDSS